MKYTVFDIETANKEMSSICSIGIVVVENDKIVDTYYSLIKPTPYYFEDFYYSINDINEEMVQNSSTFDLIWPEIKKYFDNKLVLAHFSQFDIKGLRAVFDYYKLGYPNSELSCSWALSRRGIKGLKNYKLNTIAKYYNIDFYHHNALEDAKATAKILINLCKDNEVSDLDELHTLLKIEKGYLKKDASYIGPRSMRNSSKPRNSKPLNARDITVNDINLINVNNPFYQCEVVFTGSLEKMTRKEAFQKVVNIGGIVNNGVTQKTNYLILGNSNYLNFEKGIKTSKLIKAENLIEKGQNLQIIDEDDFYKMIF